MVIAIVVVALIILWGILTYNKLIRLRIKGDESFATMDVYLKKRYDLIPNLVETVKGYARHEAETLEKVIRIRNNHVTMTPEEAIEEDNQITGALRQIFALQESYPELKANSNFIELMNGLKAVEEDIANARKYYNAVIKLYNTAIMVVPSNIVAMMFKFEKRSMFEIQSEKERQNIQVKF